MTNNQKNIEIEFRSIISEEKYNAIKQFLGKGAKDLGEDDKDVYFFIMPDKLLKVVNNISKGNAKVVLKLNKIGKGSDFEEKEFSISQKDVGTAAEMFKRLSITKTIMQSFQKRHNYLYKDVELAVKYSEQWGYHVELEIVIEDKQKQLAVESKIKSVADELGIKLMTDQELAEFTRKAEEEHKRKTEQNKKIHDV